MLDPGLGPGDVGVFLGLEHQQLTHTLVERIRTKALVQIRPGVVRPLHQRQFAYIATIGTYTSAPWPTRSLCGHFTRIQQHHVSACLCQVPRT